MKHAIMTAPGIARIRRASRCDEHGPATSAVSMPLKSWFRALALWGWSYNLPF